MPPTASTSSDLTDIQLNSLNMAVGLSQKLVNEIVSLSLPPKVTLSFNYDENFNAVQPAGAYYSFTGTLDLSQTPTPIDCGVVGGAIGSGVVCNLPLVNGTATVNKQSYSTEATPWIFQVILDAFELQVSPTTVSSQAVAQYTYMQDTYPQGFITGQYGLSFNQPQFLPSQPAPANWAASDWVGFCAALQHYLTNEPLTYTLPLMDAVLPQSNALWNGGPTAWRCFNVPPYDSSCQGAVIFGYMVQGNALPPAYQDDFTSARLFTDSSNNAFLLLSGSVVETQFLENLLPQSFLQQAAQVALVPDATNAVFSITPGTIAQSAASYGSDPWSVSYSGSTTLNSSKTIFRYFLTERATTNAYSSMVLAVKANGYYQQVQANGQYTISAQSGGNQLGYQWTMPSTLFTWSTSAVMNVSSKGIVSFSLASTPPSFPDEIDSSNSPDTQTWWAKWGGHSDLKTAQYWGTAASILIQNNFCNAGTGGQFNLFAFPGGALYTFASAGINPFGTLVLLLTYQL